MKIKRIKRGTGNNMSKKLLFDPNLSEPMPLSRSKIDLFLKCPKCFYLDRKLGISQPSGAPFTLNMAVDTLLKKEFDVYRQKKKIGRAHV